MGLDELVGEFCLVLTYINYNIERDSFIKELSKRFEELQNTVEVMNWSYVTSNYQVMGLQVRSC